MHLLVIIAATIAATILGRRAGGWLLRQLGRHAALEDSRIRRLRLTRSDGLVYLDRWGVELKRVGGVFLHRMNAPDPGWDLHDHPWTFVSLILKGGYVERRANVRTPLIYHEKPRRLGSLGATRLDQAHTISRLRGRTSWSLVIHGPRVRLWGFYVPHPVAIDRWSWVDYHIYAKAGLAKLRRDGVGS